LVTDPAGIAPEIDMPADDASWQPIP